MARTMDLLKRTFRRRSGGGSGNYAYVTARVRAKKQALLPRDTYPKLLHRDLPEIARTLQEGNYKDEVDELGGRYRGAELIERATRLNMGRTYSAVLGFAKGELKTMLELFLGRYDIYNVKTLLRGKFAGASVDEILAELIPAGSLSREQLEQLARADNLEDLVQGLKATPFGPVVTEHLEGVRDVGSLFDVENALDKVYYELLHASIPSRGRANQAFRDYIEHDIDVVNLMTFLRLRAEGLQDLEPYWVPNGANLRVDDMTRLLKARADEVTAELSNLKWWASVEAGVTASLESGNLNPAMTALEQERLEVADNFGHRHPLSVLPVVDFLLRKEVEVDNLRIIASGKETDLPEEVIEGLIHT